MGRAVITLRRTLIRFGRLAFHPTLIDMAQPSVLRSIQDRSIIPQPFSLRIDHTPIGMVHMDLAVTIVARANLLPRSCYHPTTRKYQSPGATP
jgi:hypothetical protein